MLALPATPVSLWPVAAANIDDGGHRRKRPGSSRVLAAHRLPSPLKARFLDPQHEILGRGATSCTLLEHIGSGEEQDVNALDKLLFKHTGPRQSNKVQLGCFHAWFNPAKDWQMPVTIST